MADLKKRGGEEAPAPRSRKTTAGRLATAAEKPEAKTPRPAAIEIREFRARDASDLRRLWEDAGIEASDDDDATLKRVVERNPGLLLVAVQDKVVVGAALGAWDGRLGWIHRVAVAPDHGRTDLATRLLRDLEERLRKVGAAKVNAVVRDDDPRAALFWEAAGYDRAPTRLYRRELEER
jgi:ribosomal protein S18 acetylase RimI-like enzyme